MFKHKNKIALENITNYYSLPWLKPSLRHEVITFMYDEYKIKRKREKYDLFEEVLVDDKDNKDHDKIIPKCIHERDKYEIKTFQLLSRFSKEFIYSVTKYPGLSFCKKCCRLLENFSVSQISAPSTEPSSQLHIGLYNSWIFHSSRFDALEIYDLKLAFRSIKKIIYTFKMYDHYLINDFLHMYVELITIFQLKEKTMKDEKLSKKITNNIDGYHCINLILISRISEQNLLSFSIYIHENGLEKEYKKRSIKNNNSIFYLLYFVFMHFELSQFYIKNKNNNILTIIDSQFVIFSKMFEFMQNYSKFEILHYDNLKRLQLNYIQKLSFYKSKSKSTYNHEFNKSNTIIVPIQDMIYPSVCRQKYLDIITISLFSNPKQINQGRP